jgi:dTDP-glucose 4,6-dehydratase
MHAVITGGAGFLGSHLADAHIARGDRVTVIDNLETGREINIAPLRSNPAFRFLNLDVTREFDLGEKMDIIYHFASPASPAEFKRIPLKVLLCGSFATHHLLKLAEQYGAIFFLASTSEVYGDPQEHPQPETYWGNVNPVGPRACYDEAKRYAESATVTYRDYRGARVRIARFFNTYGPRMRMDDGRVVPNFIKQALKGEPLTVYGDGLQTRSFGFYDDIIRGVLMLADSDFQDPVNFGTHVELTMLQFAQAVSDAVGIPINIKHLPAAEDDPKQRHPDITRAHKVLGWTPKVSLEDGLRITVEYYRKELQLIG